MRSASRVRTAVWGAARRDFAPSPAGDGQSIPSAVWQAPPRRSPWAHDHRGGHRPHGSRERVGDGDVKLLLDTHVWIWSQELPGQLGDQARALLTDEANELYVSPVSSLEVARLLWGGRLTLAGSLRTWLVESLEALGAETASFDHQVAIQAYSLPGEFHRDPADRILVATAMVQTLTLMTADERILEYPHVASVDARK
ncbi:MAG: hypothetical protein COZ57_19465 [Armatimonadetes bacterium CG_4_8_14_3_um_filter_66_20]|nr:MAG: hypothetical protein COZ57_19465 [Armatimonadetes bacterium CG_4_8_14_3_um_filter_66_20]